MAEHNAHHERGDHHDSGHRHHYYRLLGMVVLSFVAMYVLMYAMVNSFANVYNNVNHFYMAGLMAAPMALIELALMSSMYRDKRLNIIISVASILALVVFFILIRQQTAITDSQFLRSMIPHHASAILMCEKSRLKPLRSRSCARLSLPAKSPRFVR
jgi:hypothetical protein